MLETVHIRRLRVGMKSVERRLRLGALHLLLLLLLGAGCGEDAVRFGGLETGSAKGIDVEDGLIVTSSKA